MTESKEDQIDLRTLVPGFRLDWSGLRNRFEDELPRFEKLTTYEMRAAYLDELARQFEDAVTEALALSASSPPVGGSGEVVADAIARAQETLNNAKVTGENPTSQRALEYRLGELINLLAAPVPNGVPEGWRLVPVEPTYEMADAGDNFMPQFVLEEAPTPAGIDVARDVWAAMLAASPVTPEGLSGGEK